MRRLTLTALALCFAPHLALAADVVEDGYLLQPTEENAAAGYDFVPGDKVLFFEDFAPTADKKADPLKRLKKVSERIDLQTRPDGRWLRCRPPCSFEVALPEKLPERFTVEFDLAAGPGSNGLAFTTLTPDGSIADGNVWATASPSTMSFGGGGEDDRSNEIDRLGIDGEKPIHFSWAFDGAKVKGYAAQFRGLNLPNLKMTRTNRMRFDFVGGDDPGLIDQNVPTFIANLRIAGGGNAVMFEALSKTGRLTLPGILFDTASDRIRPESAPTLAAVAKMLAENPELKLTVEGHTDNQGVPAANLALSDKRAAAVKAWLVTKHKVVGARLETKGLGQTKPVGANDTAEGRQANRRVEIVKR